MKRLSIVLAIVFLLLSYTGRAICATNGADASIIDNEKRLLMLGEVWEVLEGIDVNSFGGYYYTDDQENFIVNLTQFELLESLRPYAGVLYFRVVPYSLGELEEMRSFLDAHDTEYGINQMYTDVINNRVIVGLDKDNEQTRSAIAEALTREDIYCEGGIFIEQRERVEPL